MVCHTPDMKNLYLRRKDYAELEYLAELHQDEFIIDVPTPWEDPVAYEFFLSELKTALLILDWIDEKSEDEISSKFDVGPGDIQRIIETAEWLVHATYEIARLFKFKDILPMLRVLENRIKKGVKQELLQIIKLRGVGRRRARILFDAGYKTLSALKNAKEEELSRLPLIGRNMAAKILKQIGKGSIKEGGTEKSQRQQKTLKDY